ncbi:MAG: hypothetical protein JSW50_07345, partial [Candidatus Latescibacterota bacterium]
MNVKRMLQTAVVATGLVFSGVGVNGEVPSDPRAVAPLKTRMYDVFPDGQIGYVAVTSGLRIIDLSKVPDTPEIASIVLPHAATAVVALDGVAFVAHGPAGVSAVSTNRADSPSIIATIDTPGSAMMVDIADDILAVADGSAGLTVIDVSDPSAPRRTAKGQWDSYVRGARFYLHELYVCAGKTGVVVMEIDTEGKPQILGSTKTAGDARDICFGGQRAFVADGKHGITAIDVSDAKAPRVLSTAPVKDLAHGIAVNERKTTIYVADGLDGIGVFNVDNSGGLTLIRQTDTEGGYANKVAVSDNRLFVAN